MKPRLEGLEERAVPSASPGNPFTVTAEASLQAAPSVAAVTSYVDTTLNQVGHLIETAEQDLLGEFQTLEQNRIEELAKVFQQLQRLFGVTPPTASESDNGSGSGAMTMTHENTPANTLHPLTNGSGSGRDSGPNSASGSPLVSFETSGTQIPESTGCMTNVTLGVFLSGPSTQTVSVYATTSDGSATAGTDYTAEDEQVIFQPGQTTQTVSIPILDDGDDEGDGSSQYFNVTLNNPNGATLGTPNVCQVNIVEGPQQQAATDTLRWNPCPDSQDLASDSSNWYDVTQGFQLQKGALGPNPSSPIQFDAYPGDTPHSDAPIIWNQSYTVASFTLNEYDGQQTLNAGININANGGQGNTALSMYNNSDLKVNFSGGNKFVLHGFGSIENLDLTGDPTSTFELAGLTTYIASVKGEHANIGVQFQIDAGATLDDLGYNALVLTKPNLTINVNGYLNIGYGQNATNTLIDGQGNANDYINVNTTGTLTYTGYSGTTDTFTVPVVVQGGSLQQTGGMFIVNGGKLVVQNGVAATQNVSVYLASQYSGVSLKQGATLECDNGYSQASGTLSTVGSPACFLQVGQTGKGTANINGGNLTINGEGSAGKLNVAASTLNFAGTFKVGIQGNNSGQYGVLDVTGSMNLNAGNSLSVVVNGQLNNGNMWPIITTSGNNIAQFTNGPNIAPGLTGHNNKPRNGDYQVTSP